MYSTQPQSAQALTAQSHLADVLSLAMKHAPQADSMVVWDERSALSRLMGEAYCAVLPNARRIRFDEVAPQEVIDACNALAVGSLVVLVQSGSFRLDAFRIRVELFKRGLKVIEHPHLASMNESEISDYVASLAYDPNYYRPTGRALQERLDRASGAVVESGADARLVYDGPFESAKVNIGDYTGMTNVGGQFPIGEVFTEARDLEKVNGQVRIFAFGDTLFRVNTPDKSITLQIEAGRIVSAQDSTPAFDTVLACIRAEENEVWIRELGFGLNRAFSRERRVSDIGSYERMCGVHLSLGAKHNVYAKPNFKRKEVRYHVDVFANTERVLIDREVVYQNGAWCV
jgi:aminopeptidase